MHGNQRPEYSLDTSGIEAPVATRVLSWHTGVAFSSELKRIDKLSSAISEDVIFQTTELQRSRGKLATAQNVRDQISKQLQEVLWLVLLHDEQLCFQKSQLVHPYLGFIRVANDSWFFAYV